MRSTSNGVFFRKKVSGAEAERRKKERKEEPTPESKPYRGSDGHWYRWVNDGRGGYTEVLPRSEEDRLDWDGGR